MDWTAFALSVRLAIWTLVLLLPFALWLGRVLAWGRFRGKGLVEAMVARVRDVDPDFFERIGEGPLAEDDVVDADFEL